MTPIWQAEQFLADTIARLYILDYGRYLVYDETHGREIGIVGYLLETKDGRYILVDTGFPAKYAVDAAKANSEDDLDSFGRVLHLDEHNLPPGQLAQMGLTPADINLLIITHGDVDHVGFIDAFPQAPIVMSRTERAMPQPRYVGGRSPIDWPQNATYHLIDGDTILEPGIAILESPGHTPGHISVLVRLAETGPVLIAADALARPAELEVGNGGAWHREQALTSARRLVAIAKETKAMLIYGHDPQQWPELRKAPAFYE